jgi:adenosylhomocysteine nucleosidase
LLGVLCATPEELAALRARLALESEPERRGPTRVFHGHWRGEALAVAESGIGKVHAAAATTLLLDRFGARSLIFAGVAGSLDATLPVGSVLLADRLAIHDYGLLAGRAFTPVEYGVIPIGAPRLATLPPVPQAVARTLRALAEQIAPELGHPIRLGGVVTADYFLNCGETREELRRELGADAIDMESGAVGQVAQAWGAPLYVIRTVSDLAGEDSHIAYPQMAAMAAANSALCVATLLDLLTERG